MSGDDPDSERRAFEALWEAQYPAILAYARRRFDEEDARDIAAETFLVAWRRRKDLPDRETTPWLYGVARRVAADRHRAIARAGRLSVRLANERPGAERAVDPEGARRLLAALGELSEGDRELLLLTAWEGLTPAQAAVALSCSPATVRVRLHRARARLRRLLSSAEESAASA
ncbi:MAG TPA: sigma-70 family RNA polymerase sigma factor, partial [Candidatus Limnocylindrales bacterium]|nr:sigma-70 family RNA polymerase sigma factor [Candidatus Limnocylindrales bacterium]